MRLTFLLLLTILLAATAAPAQDVGATRPTTPRRLSLTFELKDMPGLKAPGSRWEVSYQWRIADQREFDRWSTEGEDPAKQNAVGVLLSKTSFSHQDLSKPENRRFSTSIKLRGDLLRRMRNAGRRPQIVWLDATVRIRDGALGTDFVNRVNPAWGPDFYLTGAAKVRMELTPAGTLVWTRKEDRVWGQERPMGVTVSSRPWYE
jgi:hypothetical protein